jgi:hypothetical protein
MNKRIRKKIEKREQELRAAAGGVNTPDTSSPVPQRGSLATRVAQGIGAAAQALEEKAEHLLEKVPIVGDQAAKKLHDLAMKV